MKGIVVRVTDEILIGSLRNLYEQGEITIEQYAASLRRYNERRQKAQNLWG